MTSKDACPTLGHFRFKIWDRDQEDFIVYDNDLGTEDDGEFATELGGEVIVIPEARCARE